MGKERLPLPGPAVKFYLLTTHLDSVCRMPDPVLRILHVLSHFRSEPEGGGTVGEAGRKPGQEQGRQERGQRASGVVRR